VIGVGAGVTVFKSRRSTPGSRATSRPAAAIRSTSTGSKRSATLGLIHWAFRPFDPRACRITEEAGRPVAAGVRRQPASFQPQRKEHPMHPYNNDEVARGEGISRAVRDALADPIVQALLVADRVDPRDVADLSRRMAAWLSHREAIGSAGAEARFPLGCIRE
jgi:hypothetical protein